MNNVHVMPMTCVRFAYKDERTVSLVFNNKTKRVIMEDGFDREFSNSDVMYRDWRIISRKLRKDGWRLVSKMEVTL
jgi:hypothetical protein